MPQEDASPKNTEKLKRILIVDDHPIVRRGLTELVGHEKDLVVCGEAENAAGALEALKTLRPNMAIVDYSLPGRSGMDLVKDIQAQNPTLPILFLSMHDESIYAERALRAGARGYIMKQEAPEKVIVAIRTILAGEVYISNDMAKKLVSRLVSGGPQTGASEIQRLSDREVEVLRLIGKGDGTCQIADILHLSTKTVETHRANIKVKLNLKSAVELRKYAIQWTHSTDSE
ncbi:MAG: response regulator transcription factor [Planctomycetes bacterium]|nr:response regulator transcription factor [Planctomycetota bacterium]